MKTKENITKQRFIIDYLLANYSTDACDQLFHEKWTEQFGGKAKPVNWGASMSYSAQRWLKKLYDEGTLNRGIVTLGANWQPGFPKWVYGYTLANPARYRHERTIIHKWPGSLA